MVVHDAGLDGAARRNRWVPGERPAWLAAVNSEGRHFDLPNLVPLDERSLIDAACRATGLDDFGADDWREPFSVLVKSLEEEAELNLFGRLMTRSDLLITLQARLRVEDTYKRHPEIDDGQIIKPLCIVGQGRSGTSVLQNLLSADPNNGTTRNWEVLFPCPPPEAATYETDPRVARADGLTQQWNRVVPELVSMHEFGGPVPTESVHLHCLSFHSPAWFGLMGQTPSYTAYILGQDQNSAYRYEKRVLKLLQWRNPRRTWVMKSPYTLLQLPSYLEVYPDGCIVWPHRDPVKALASIVSLLGTLQWARSDVPFRGEALTQFTNSDLVAGMVAQPIGWLEDGSVPRERLCNLQYRDFVADPMAVVAHIYDYFGLELGEGSRTAMERFMQENPRSGRPSHAYDVGDANEIELERAAFQTYTDYFAVPAEL